MTLQERFLRYVKINTTSDENGQGCPSAACEWELARLLADEMRAMGVSNVRLDAHAYVYGEIPANCEHAPAIGLIAHMDTVDAVNRRIADDVVKFSLVGHPIPSSAAWYAGKYLDIAAFTVETSSRQPLTDRVQQHLLVVRELLAAGGWLAR